MLCPSCHTLNRENARFCKGCGKSFVDESQQGLQSHQANGVENAGTGIAVSATQTPAVTTDDASTQTATEQPGQSVNQQPEDISMAPTLVLPAEQMLELHARHWHDEQQEAHEQNGSDIADIADQPTMLINPTVAGNSQADDIAEQPTIATTPEEVSAMHEEQNMPASQVPSEPTTQATTEPVAPTPENADEQPALNATADEQDAAVPAASENDEQSNQQAANTAFPVLEIGTNLIGRYEILQVLSADEQEHIYQAVDHQGYQRCWNCGSEQNAEGNEFCDDCGAELLNVAYIMHEYPATASQDSESHVLMGQIVNTFMDQGRTYLIEQPQIAQPSFPNGVHLLVATDSDAGMLRRGDPNEDSTLVIQMQRIHESLSSPFGVFIVADGMGGHDDGQGASRMTINVIAERITHELLLEPLRKEKEGEQSSFSEDDLIALLKGAIQDANTALCQDNQRNKTDKGSTVTGFMIVGDHAYIINVGDSRTYMLRDGKLYQLTNDHSLVGQLVAGGLIEPDDVYTHPQRSQIFRSLGDKLHVQVDDFKQQLHPGDILLSCCDGLWEMVRNPQITEILANAPDPQTACSQLIEAANTNGGEDNISAVVVFARE